MTATPTVDELEQLTGADQVHHREAHREAIVAELLSVARARDADLRIAVAELERATAAWQATARRWHPHLAHLGLDGSPDRAHRDIPTCPTIGAVEQLRHAYAALPEHLRLPAPWTAIPVDELPDTPRLVTPWGSVGNPRRRAAEPAR